MSSYLARHRTDLMIIGLFGLVFALSFVFGWEGGQRAAASFRDFALEMIVVLVIIGVMVGGMVIGMYLPIFKLAAAI